MYKRWKLSYYELVEFYPNWNITQPNLYWELSILIHLYLDYSILNWGRASNATIQLRIKLQNKDIKLIRPTNTASLEEPFQHLNILCLPKLYTLSVGKFMHSYNANCFQAVLMNILFQSAQFILTPQNYQFPTTCFYLELTLPQEIVSLHLLAQKCGRQHQTVWSLMPLLPSNGNLKKTVYMKKIHNFKL